MVRLRIRRRRKSSFAIFHFKYRSRIELTESDALESLKVIPRPSSLSSGTSALIPVKREKAKYRVMSIKWDMILSPQDVVTTRV
jgi:hypothetical protein